MHCLAGSTSTFMKPTSGMSDPGPGGKLKVFISYSRRDSAEFADELVAGLELGGFAPFLDRHDIAAGEDWEARLGALIGESDTVVFVVSPESVKSERCVWEVERTRELSKRILPVVYKPVPDSDIPPALGRLQFIRFDTGRGLARALSELAASLQLDLDWIREHTRLGELAARWTARGRPESLLLRGGELDAAKAWQAERKPAALEITETQRTFLAASEEAESARLGKERAQLEAMRLAQEVTALSQKRAARRLWGVAALMVGSFAYVLLQGYDVSRREVAVFSDLATQAMNEGRFDRAMRYALQAYPARGHLPFLTPFSTELEGSLAGGAQSTRLHRILRGHSRQLKSVAFTPDDSRILTGSDDGTARMWDAESGSPLVLVKTEDGRPLTSVTLSPDGTRILASSADAAARMWDAASGRELVAFKGHTGFVNAVAFDHDGRRIATVSRDKTARIWDADSGQELLVLTGHITEFRCKRQLQFVWKSATDDRPGGRRGARLGHGERQANRRDQVDEVAVLARHARSRGKAGPAHRTGRRRPNHLRRRHRPGIRRVKRANAERVPRRLRSRRQAGSDLGRGNSHLGFRDRQGTRGTESFRGSVSAGGGVRSRRTACGCPLQRRLYAKSGMSRPAR